MRPECWRWLPENGDMLSDTNTDASDATTPGPELRNGQLVVLLAREQPPDVQAQVDERNKQAWDELKRRGVHQVPAMHWNYGSARRTQTADRLYDQDWYKRLASVVAAMHNQWWRLLACFNR